MTQYVPQEELDKMDLETWQKLEQDIVNGKSRTVNYYTIPGIQMPPAPAVILIELSNRKQAEQKALRMDLCISSITDEYF